MFFPTSKFTVMEQSQLDFYVDLCIFYWAKIKYTITGCGVSIIYCLHFHLLAHIILWLTHSNFHQFISVRKQGMLFRKATEVIWLKIRNPFHLFNYSHLWCPSSGSNETLAPQNQSNVIYSYSSFWVSFPFS